MWYNPRLIPLSLAGLSLLALFLGLAGPVHGQANCRSWIDSTAVLTHARADIRTLCSDSLAGRGYQAQGHLKAAHWLAEAFQQAGIAPLANYQEYLKPGGRDLKQMPLVGYLQPFSFATNRIRKASVSIGPLKQLEAGRDFLPAPHSPAVSGQFSMIDAGHALPREIEELDLVGKFAIVRPGLPERLEQPDSTLKAYKHEDKKAQALLAAGAAGMIYLQSDLNYGFSPRQKGLPTLYVQESVYRASWGRKNLSPKLFVQIQAKVDTIQSQNVTGFLPGSDPEAPAIVFCAHYDHLGQLGDAVFAGANDNASGTALMLSLARHYACLPQAQRPPYNLIFIGFGAEETGLNGSIHYAWREPQFPLDRTALVLDFDLMGYGQDGMMTVGGKTYTKLFNALQRTNRQLSNPLRLKARPNAPNSDHYPFTEKGVPGLFFYALGGKSYYHDIYDRPKALTLTAFWPVRQLMLNYVRGLEASDLP